ncbi:NAD(P)H-binding protein [Methanobrevibacter sp.]|uniref:NAD(P)H-binding protein n=1 Tax=Methanobrevibacter sp. TaxID=66852 RepID=UPI00389077F6
MNIAVIGATGKFGRLFISKLLSIPNYQITAISKSAENIYENSHRVTAKSIDATNQKDLKSALENQDIVFCAVSGSDQVTIARNLTELNVNRLIFMSVVGIYNELPKGNGDEFNLDNEPEQRVHRNATDIIENSSLDYTILRSGYIAYQNEEDYVITKKGEPAKGYVSNAKSIKKIVLDIIKNPKLYSCESISVTRDMS